MRISTIQVGLPKEYPAPSLRDGSWTTATYKERVTGPVQLLFLGLTGDGHADLLNHGGRNKAVLCYSEKHYAFWRKDLGISNFTNGALGENFTVTEGSEDDVCVGDQYSVGDAVVEVSQPRQPCWKQSLRWDVKDLVPRIVQAGSTGWYLRVLREGVVEEGMELVLMKRPHPEWTIATANAVYHDRAADPARVKALADLSLLSMEWRSALANRLLD